MSLLLLFSQQSSGGSSTVLDSTPGNLSINEVFANLGVGRQTSLDSLAYTYSGQLAYTVFGRVVSTTGTYDLTGSIAQIGADRNLPLAYNSYSTSGTVAQVSATRGGLHVAGAYSITGTVAQTTAAYTSINLAGSYASSGLPLTLSQGKSATFYPSSFSLGGQIAVVIATRQLPSTNDAYALTGQTVTFVNGAPVDIPYALPGELVIVGVSSTASITRNNLPNTFNLSLTAANASQVRNNLPTSLTLSGINSICGVVKNSLPTSFALSAPTSTFVSTRNNLPYQFKWTVADPSMVSVRKSTLYPTAFNITGSVTPVTATRKSTLASGSLTIGAIAATTTRLANMSITSGMLSISGSAQYVGRTVPLASYTYNIASSGATIIHARGLRLSPTQLLVTGSSSLLDLQGRLVYDDKYTIKLKYNGLFVDSLTRHYKVTSTSKVIKNFNAVKETPKATVSKVQLRQFTIYPTTKLNVKLSARRFGIVRNSSSFVVTNISKV